MDVRVTDEEWKFLSSHLSHLPRRAAHSRGRPRASDRALFEGILWILANGGRWRDLPRPQYPAKSSCYRRFAQWSRDGSWQNIQKILIRMLGGKGKIDLAEGFIDGTLVRAKKGVLRLAARERIFEARKAA
jgi:transposase